MKLRELMRAAWLKNCSAMHCAVDLTANGSWHLLPGKLENIE